MIIAVFEYRGFQNISQKRATAMINLDNLVKLRSLSKEIILITKDAEFKNDNQLSVKICQLLDMLVHMQSLNISIRSELIEKLFSIRPDLSHKIINQKKQEQNIILFARRKVNRTYCNRGQAQECPK
jgi:hypothetical protein